MRFMLGWIFKFAFVGMLYLAFTSGYKIELPETVMGYKVPDAARQWADRGAQIGEYGRQTQSGFKSIADGFK